MADLNNLGSFSSLSDLWKSFPEGGREGDFVYIGNTKYRWNRFSRTWMSVPPNERKTIVYNGRIYVFADTIYVYVISDDRLSQEPQETDCFRNLGTYNTLQELWKAHPEGGREFDYATVSGEIVVWDKYLKSWTTGEILNPGESEPVIPQTPTNLGEYDTMAQLWKAFPEGGREYDYAIVGGEIYVWNKYIKSWEIGDIEEPTDPQPPVETEPHYLGSYTTMAELWTIYPYGGKEGDYVDVGGETYYWNKYKKTWGIEGGVEQDPTREHRIFEGDVTVNNNLTVAGALKARYIVGYARKDWVKAQGYLTEHQDLSDYATKDWVKENIKDVSPGLMVDDADKWDGHQFADYLDQPVRKKDDVEFNSVTTDAVQSKDFHSGLLGSGFRLTKSKDGNASLELDNLTVRKTLKVFELIIQQLQYQGGVVIYSAASCICTEVEELSDGYKCYFDTKNGSEPNLFAVGDQARCQRFDIGTTTAKYYWRLVTEVGGDYIVLSKSDCDSGSDAPEKDDNIIQLGNRTDRERQAAKITSVTGDNTPRDEYYKGIDSYDLTGKCVTVVGVKDGRVGIFTDDGMFSGSVVIGEGSSGLSNLDEWAEQSDRISSAWQEALDANESAESAMQKAEDALTYVDDLRSIIDDLNSDNVLDLNEKGIVRTQWVNINGIESTARGSTRGSYYTVKKSFSEASFVGNRSFMKYNGRIYTYNGAALVYDMTGIANLDAAYMELRSYLNMVELNDRTNVFKGFDRDRFADLLTAYCDAEDHVRDMISDSLNNKIDDTRAEMNAQIEAYQTAIQESVKDLQGQIDGSIMTWFSSGVPTLENYPVIADEDDPETGWDTEDKKKKHIGDLYYDEDSGFAYRFQKNNSGQYYWNLIQDKDITKALADAKTAQDTADSKRRTFLSQPLDSDTYDPGDIWVNATYGDLYSNDLLRATKAKAAGVAFSIDHWVLATKYTDDTIANEAKNAAIQAQQKADQAAADAEQAEKDAQDAIESANRANEKLTDWASDSIISPTEKESLRQQRKDVETEYSEILEQAEKYKDHITDYPAKKQAFTDAYTKAIAAFTYYTEPEPESIEIITDTGNPYCYNNISLYYDARVLFSEIIAQSAKSLADKALADAESAWQLANEAKDMADEAQKAADSALQKAENAIYYVDNLRSLVDDLNNDTVLDLKEKGLIRTQWVNINGIESTMRGSERGSYYTVKKSFDEIDSYGAQKCISYKGTVYTFSSTTMVYNISGISDLDAAYLELRAYLNSVELNDRENTFKGFDRDRFSELLTAYCDAEDRLRDIIANSLDNKIKDTKAELNAQIEAYQTAVQSAVSDLQGQIDGSIMTWFGTGEPTLSSYPVTAKPGEPESGWDTVEIKKKHIGDLYYDDESGFAYRFQTSSTGEYYWKLIQDKDIAKALSDAQRAQDTADSKRKVFFSQPQTDDSYDPGDLWVNATYGENFNNDLLRAKTAKAAGIAFNIAHWTLATKYTDDTVANEARETAELAQQKAERAADDAKAAAEDAQSALESAEEANSKLSDWASDSVISPTEKEALRQQRKDVETEYSEVIEQGEKYKDYINDYSSRRQAYTSAYNKAITAFAYYTNASPESIPIITDASNANCYNNIALYYDARALYGEIIAQAAKSLADQALSDAESAWQLASQADNKAAAALEALDAIDDDTMLDLIEKGALRTEWVAINGIESTMQNGNSGSYYNTRESYKKSGTGRIAPIFNGKLLIYGNVFLGYSISGLSNLDAAYLELRGFLNSIELNDRTHKFYGFDRDTLSELLKRYYDAENAMKDNVLSELEVVKDALNGFAKDNQIDESEKRTLKAVYEDEVQSRLELLAKASPYVLLVSAVKTSQDNYETAYTEFVRVVRYYVETKGNVPIVSTYPLESIYAFYEKRNAFVQAINDAEKKYIDSKDTKTQIDGGIITSGSIQLGDNDTPSKVGLSGEGNLGTSIRIWAGATMANRASAPYRVNDDGEFWSTNAHITGEVNATSGIFKNVKVSGTLDGVTGSFKSLNCVDNSGNIIATISFSAEGRMWFNNGDLYHQGAKNGRGLRFYSSDIWCRGAFGARERTVLEVNGSYGYIYPNGISGTKTRISLETTYGSINPNMRLQYAKVPCYGEDGDYAGMPIDIVVLNISQGEVAYFLFEMSETQRVLVVNPNYKSRCGVIVEDGYVEVNRGRAVEIVKLKSFQTSSQIGAGLYPCALSYEVVEKQY